MTTSIDPQLAAQEELAANMVPTPDDLISDLTPMAALYYLEQLGWQVFTMWTGFASEASTGDDLADSDLSETLQGIGAVVGAVDTVCERIGLIPPGATLPASL